MKLDPVIEQSPLRIEQDGSIAILRMVQPARRNLLTPAMRTALQDALAAANADADIAAIVIAADGPAFCGGGDLGTMGDLSESESEARILDAHKLPRAIHESPKPVIAAVEGGCAGAGLALAAICDLLVAGRDARFVTAFEKVGLMPDLGACWSVSARIGPQAARRLFLLGGDLTADGAAACGLCDVLVPVGRAEEEAVALARRATRCAPGTRRAVREVFARNCRSFDEILKLEAELQPPLYRSEDLREGIAAFRERRDPVWRGR